MHIKKLLLAFSFWLLALNPAWATLAIDGAVSATPADAAVQTITLTTTNSNDVIILILKSNNTNTVSGIADVAGLSWAKRKQINWSGGANDLEEWYAIAASPLSADVITVTWTSTGAVGGRDEAYGISGANTSVPFDTDAGQPYSVSTAAASTSTTTITTTTANDMLITTGYISGGGLSSRPSGFTQIVSSGSFADVAYKVVSATQSGVNVTYTWSAGFNAGMITDAVVQASGGGGGGSDKMFMMGSP